MSNLATYHQDQVTKGVRAAEVPDADFDGGLNKGGSCTGGLGINTGAADPKVDDWTTLDQAGAARDPQASQHIGGDGLGAGNTANEPLRAINGADVNDTLSLVVVAANAADGVGMEAGNTGTVNRTGAAVVIGQRVWGTDTVA